MNKQNGIESAGELDLDISKPELTKGQLEFIAIGIAHTLKPFTKEYREKELEKIIKNNKDIYIWEEEQDLPLEDIRIEDYISMDLSSKEIIISVWDNDKECFETKHII